MKDDGKVQAETCIEAMTPHLKAAALEIFALSKDQWAGMFMAAVALLLDEIVHANMRVANEPKAEGEGFNDRKN